MTTSPAPLAPADAVVGGGMWADVSRLAGDTDGVAMVAERVADHIPALLAAVDTPESRTVLSTVRAEAARELAASAARLHHASTRLHVAAAALIQSEQAHRANGETTARNWLRHHCGLTHRDASRLCRAADTAARYPAIGAAFHAGKITLGHLDATAAIIPTRFKGPELDDAIEKVRRIQPILIAAATDSTVDDYADFCQRVRSRLDTDGPADQAAEPSRVWLHRLFNGRWALTGDLTPDDGALLATILDDIRSRRNRDTTNAAGPTDGADAANDGADAAAVSDGCDTKGEQPTYSERQATDLVDLIVAGAGSGRPGRVGIYLHIDLEDLNGPAGDDLTDYEHGNARRPAHTAGGHDITDDTLWGLMAGADITPVFNQNGTPLSYGRTRRLAPPELRRILAHRDRRCRFPNCDRTPMWCDAHHIHHWDDGGTTDPANCVNLCRNHHHAHHKRGFSIAGNANGDLAVTQPDGTPVETRPAYKRRHSG